jgi:dolichol-phosphate mannosyltransferase
MSLCVFIPVFNEQEIILNTLKDIHSCLIKNQIDFELIIINDFSTDNSESIIKNFCKKNKNSFFFKNIKKGLGHAVNLAIEKAKKKYFTILMSDKSDNLDDLVVYYKTIKNKNIDAVFGSRFLSSSKVTGYPLVKLLLNRVFNYLVKILLFSNYNDFTNAFKIYKREMLISFKPFVSEDFNIFLELPMKTISRFYKYDIVPISWNGRIKGKSKFYIKELGSKYLFTLLYCFLEKILLGKKK